MSILVITDARAVNLPVNQFKAPVLERSTVCPSSASCPYMNNALIIQQVVLVIFILPFILFYLLLARARPKVSRSCGLKVKEPGGPPSMRRTAIHKPARHTRNRCYFIVNGNVLFIFVYLFIFSLRATQALLTLSPAEESRAKKLSWECKESPTVSLYFISYSTLFSLSLLPSLARLIFCTTKKYSQQENKKNIHRYQWLSCVITQLLWQMKCIAHASIFILLLSVQWSYVCKHEAD